jgi:Na+-driven multidrug efflux pump
MIDAGTRYLHTVGPVYGLFGLGMALYFASQGAGRLLWPFLANLARLLIAAAGGYIALRLTGNLTGVFIALAIALCAFGLINAAAVASGVWFDKPVKGAVPEPLVSAPAATASSAAGAIVK